MSKGANLAEMPKPVRSRERPILFVWDAGGDIGGGQKVLLDLLDALRGRFDALVGLPPQSPLRPVIEGKGFETVGIQIGEYSQGRKGLKDLFRFVCDLPSSVVKGWRAGKEVSVIYANHPRILPQAAVLGRVRGLPVIWHVHHIFVDSRALAMATLFSRMGSVRRLVCVSKRVASQFPPAVREKVRVVYNGVDTERFKFRPQERERVRKEWGIPSSAKVVAIVGRITPLKGHDVFVKSAERVLRREKEVVFVVVGEAASDPKSKGFLKRLLRMVDERGLGSKILFVGFRGDMPAVMSAIDILVVASVGEEGCPMAILEAMSCGRPVVAPDIEGVREVVVRGRTGLLFRPGLASDLSEKLSFLLREGGLMEEMGKAGRKVVEERFSLEHFRKGILRVIEEVVRGG